MTNTKKFFTTLMIAMMMLIIAPLSTRGANAVSSETSWQVDAMLVAGRIRYALTGENNITHLLERKGNKLCLDGRIIARNIKKSDLAFGIYQTRNGCGALDELLLEEGTYVLHQKGSWLYAANLRSPQKAWLIKQNVKNLVFDKKNLVKKYKASSSLQDFVKMYPESEADFFWTQPNPLAFTLYHNGRAYKTVSINGNELFLNGKKIFTFKKKLKAELFGILETNEILCVDHQKRNIYLFPLDNPKNVRIIKIKPRDFAFSYIKNGFVSYNLH